jgi:hypothetical protein
VGVFAVLVPAEHLYPYEDFVGVHFFNGALLVRSVNKDGVAGLQHVRLLIMIMLRATGEVLDDAIRRLHGFSRPRAKTLFRDA